MRFRTTGTRGGRGTLAASLLLVVLILAGCSAPDTAAQPTPQPTQSTSPRSKTPPPPADESGSLPRSRPVWIDVPGIRAHSSLVPLGLNADRTVEVPPVDQPMQAGWYKHSPAPGQTGPSVVLGHVNGGGHDGIFARLHELKPGDEIRIGREDKQVTRFVVERIEQFPKTEFPAGQVYGDTKEPELRLITCGGSFDKAANSYRDNVIVFAVFTGVVDATEPG
ncbi:class F sortase [Actinophytocola glycyrrhizae]|uniref:Class F sortase n=1 Tax=Actinophytocola glycyrrhizae TaxID=2044873 RepID=A0ABV9RVR4_9PSEU